MSPPLFGRRDSGFIPLHFGWVSRFNDRARVTRGQKEAEVNPQNLFGRVLASLHRAALDPDDWPAAAGLIDKAASIKGNALAICTGTGKTREEIAFAQICFGGRRCEDLEREYFADYWPRDERLQRLRRLPDSELVPTGDLYTVNEKETSSMYNEFLKNTGMQKGFHVRLGGPDQSQIVWTLGESAETRGWSSAQIDVIESLLPHVRHFATVQRLLAGARAVGESLAGLLDHAGTGVIQLDREACIVECNEMGARILRQRGGLFDSAGSLRALKPAEDAELQRLLANALRAYGLGAVGGSMTIARPKARTRLVLHVNPVAEHSSGFRSSRVAALVLVVDPEKRIRIAPELVREAMGLTPAEAHVAAMLAAGHSLRGIAAATDRSAGTVRWHLKRIFRKQGISKQKDLVCRVLALGGFRAS